MEGKIIKAVGGVFYVSAGNEVYAASARKKLRYGKKELTVGDNVEIALSGGNDATVENVFPRGSFLTRPAAANIDAAVIVAAPAPEPDFVLIDKILINCLKQNILPVIALNKSDMDCGGLWESIRADYSETAAQIIRVSALKGTNAGALKKLLYGKTSVFCGQSGVGKTSLLNLIAGEIGQTGGISAKSGRGKHTTRHTGLFRFAEDSYIIDTPGFSLLELDGVTSAGLGGFYPDMAAAGNCRFTNCTHTAEPGCAVREAAGNGRFSKNRYERYVKIFNELKNMEKIKF